MSDKPMRAASYLPEDIQIQILSRSLAKTLTRFRCVSKRWCSLICDPQFVQLHLTRSVLLNRENWFIAPNSIFEAHPVGGSIPSKISYLYNVGTCNGLICLCIDKEQLVVFNPSTRCYKELPLPPEINLHAYKTNWGFGYDSTIDDYKVVLCLRKLFHNKFMVLDFKDNYWRSTTPTYMISRYTFKSAVFLNGCLHWVGQANSRIFILSFDLSSEKFKEIPGPAEPADDSYVCYNMGIVEGCLWVCRPQWNGSRYAMSKWRMKEYNVQASWVKILELCLVPDGEIVLFLRKGEILVAQAGKELVAYNGLDGSRRKLIEVSRKDMLVIPYTESLISPDCGEDWKARGTLLDFMAENVAILNVETLCLPNNV